MTTQAPSADRAAVPAEPCADDRPLALPVATMRSPVLRGETRSRAWRLEQLDRLERLLNGHGAQLQEALAGDLGKSAVEASFEQVTVRQELRFTRRHLRSWMRPRPVGTPIWTWPAQAQIRSEPLGCVLIIGPFNYPLQLCLHPLVSALAAGNTAVLKPSEQTPRTAALIAELVALHFAPEVVQVVLGDAPVAARLLEERFDHIFFTGGGRVGRLVMAAAARHLTPVTLELGGRCPAVVLGDADLSTTARRLAWGKCLNAGQTCVAPDHLLVVPAIREGLVSALRTALHDFHGPDPLRSPDLGSIVNPQQFERLEALLEDARRRGAVLHGGRCDREARRIEPTLVAVEHPEEDPLMQEEIFGPILPVVTVNDLGAALARIRLGPSPLALYLFGGHEGDRRRLLDGSRSGSVVFNDVIVQAGMVPLPFGGVGESGMGSYHGEAGFRTFSHHRSVVRRPFRPDLPFRYPPYAGKLGWIERLMG